MRRILALACLLVALATSLVVGVAAPSSAATTAGNGLEFPTAAQLDAYLAGKGSPMAGQGSAFLASGGRWQVDPRLLVAIAGAESNFGVITCAPFNAWGYGCPNGPFRFTSWADGIDTVAKGLRENYLAEGRTTVALINMKYAPIGAENDPTGLNNHWTVNVSKFLIELGGDPDDIDISGIAGTRLLGMAAGATADYGFEEERPAADADAAGDAGQAADLEVTTGTPRPLTVTVRNTGDKAWTPTTIRLRRVDLESRIVGDPYGSLVDDEEVRPGGTARFVVMLAAAATHDGGATTRWRLEGPSGPFGGEIVREVAFAVPPFVVGPWRMEQSVAASGVRTVVVHVRNAGRVTWRRGGAERVVLGVVESLGGASGVGWTSASVPAVLLEREVAPGEEGSFAFRMQGEGALAVLPFTASGWAAGRPYGVAVGERFGEQARELAASIDNP